MTGVVSNKLLEPHPWHLGQSPPPLEPHAASHPLLLLIDSRDPLQAAVGEAHIAILSREERERHRAYRFPADRQRFLLAHASLRVILGRWLGISPRLITIEPGRQGKPHCLNAGAPLFNLSHSGDLILLGFHPTLEVGVDVEQARPNINWLPIARRVLPAAELTALLATPTAWQKIAFLAAWCRLEARLKAQGTGLGGLERLRDGDSSHEAQPSQLWDVKVPIAYAAAVALYSQVE